MKTVINQIKPSFALSNSFKAILPFLLLFLFFSNTFTYAQLTSLEQKAFEQVKVGDNYMAEAKKLVDRANKPNTAKNLKDYLIQQAEEMRRDANSAYSKAATMYEQAKNYNKAAEYYEKTKQIDKAIAAYEKAGNHAKTAEYYKKRGQRGKAITAYEKAGNYEKAADLYNQNGNERKAAESYEKAAKKDGLTAKQRIVLYKKALQLYKKMLKTNNTFLSNSHPDKQPELKKEKTKLEQKINELKNKLRNLQNRADAPQRTTRKEQSSQKKSRNQQQLDDKKQPRNDRDPRSPKKNKPKLKIVKIAILFGNGTTLESTTEGWSGEFMNQSLLTVLRLKFPRESFDYTSKKYKDNIEKLKNGTMVSFTIIRGNTKYIFNFYSRASQFKNAIINSNYVIYTGHAHGNKGNILYGYQGGAFDLALEFKKKKGKEINLLGKQIMLIRCYSSVAANTLASKNATAWGTQTTSGCIPINTQVLTRTLEAIYKGQTLGQAIPAANTIVRASNGSNLQPFTRYRH